MLFIRLLIIVFFFVKGDNTKQHEVTLSRGIGENSLPWQNERNHFWVQGLTLSTISFKFIANLRGFPQDIDTFH